MLAPADGWLRVPLQLDPTLTSPCCLPALPLKVGLRQLDMSLLCQLYSLYESIQEYKGACQAAASPDCTYALENGFFDEDEEYFQEQSSLQDEKDGGLSRNGSLPVSSLSSSDWALGSL